MSIRIQFHHHRKRWHVKRSNRERSLFSHKSQAQAIRFAVLVALPEREEVYLYNKLGLIQEKL